MPSTPSTTPGTSAELAVVVLPDALPTRCTVAVGASAASRDEAGKPGGAACATVASFQRCASCSAAAVKPPCTRRASRPFRGGPTPRIAGSVETGPDNQGLRPAVSSASRSCSPWTVNVCCGRPLKAWRMSCSSMEGSRFAKVDAMKSGKSCRWPSPAAAPSGDTPNTGATS